MSEEKKIIIDEDWKAQVEREREELTKEEVEPESQTEPAPEATEEFDASQLPPASFPLLISTMATQAMAAMGQLEDPITGKAEVNLAFAKYHIDLIAILQQKTVGNLTEDEAEMLEGALHQLRMMYVQVQQA